MADIVDNEAVAYKSALQKTTRVMNEFRKLDPEMAIQQVQTFIFCALNEPKDISVKDIADSLVLVRHQRVETLLVSPLGTDIGGKDMAFSTHGKTQ